MTPDYHCSTYLVLPFSESSNYYTWVFGSIPDDLYLNFIIKTFLWWSFLIETPPHVYWTRCLHVQKCRNGVSWLTIKRSIFSITVSVNKIEIYLEGLSASLIRANVKMSVSMDRPNRAKIAWRISLLRKLKMEKYGEVFSVKSSFNRSRNKSIVLLSLLMIIEISNDFRLPILKKEEAGFKETIVIHH